MAKRPGSVTVTTEVAYCSFCSRSRNLRREEHRLGGLVRTIVTCETCHRTLSSTMGPAPAQEEAAEATAAVAPEEAAPRAPEAAAVEAKPKPAARKAAGAKTRTATKSARPAAAKAEPARAATSRATSTKRPAKAASAQRSTRGK